MLKVWNVSLVALTYVLCIVGTFLTRSGFTSSIHTFVVSSVGWWFIGYIAIVATVAIVVIVAQPRPAALAAPHRLARLARGDVPVQQPALRRARVRDPLGRPLPVDLARRCAGHRVATQSPYYDFFAVVLGLPLLLLAGVGPGRGLAPRLAARRRAGLPLAVRLGARGRGAARRCWATPRASPGVVALSLCLFVDRHDRARAGARDGGPPRAHARARRGRRALAQLVGRNRRRYGGYVVHLAVMIGVVAIVGTSAYATSRTLVLAPGQTVQFHGYGLQLRGIESPITRSYISTEAVDRRLPGRPPHRHAAPVGAHLPRLGRADQADRDPPAAAHRRGSVPRLRRLAAARRRSRSRRSSIRSSTCSGSPPSSSCSASPSPSGPIRASRRGWRGARTRRSRALVDADRRDRAARARRGRRRARGLAARARARGRDDARRTRGAWRCWSAATRRSQALQELELDHQAGKLTDEDAERERRDAARRGRGALAELEGLERSRRAAGAGAHAARVIVQISPRRSVSRTRSRA